MTEVDWSEFFEVVGAMAIFIVVACILAVLVNSTFYTIHNRWKRDK